MKLAKTGLSANELKMIAIVAMTIDHITSVVFPNYSTSVGILFLHIIGRIAAPTIWFFIAEGYHYTRNLKRYAARLFIFAFVSHFAYNFAFGIPFIPFQTTVFNQTSVIWTLAWGLVALAIDQSEDPKWKPWMKHLAMVFICIITFCADWSSIGAMAIVQIGRHQGNFKRQMTEMMKLVCGYALVYIIFVNPLYGLIQLFVIISIPILKLYNGKRGEWNGMKWFFYFYYPAHLILAGLIRIWLHGNIGVMIGG